jgi:putative DNA primase/helicase
MSYTSPIEVILPLLKNKKRSQKGWTARCPVPEHHDKNNSLSLSEDSSHKVLIHCFGGCETKHIMRALGLTLTDLYPPKVTNKRVKKSLTLKQLAQDKQLSEAFLKELGISQKGNAIQITYSLEDGSLASRQRLRTALKAGEGSLWEKGKGNPVLYGLWKLNDARATKTLVLVEGESDCWTLWFHGFSALGFPGADMAGKLEAQHLKEIQTLFILNEKDKGGQSFISGLTNRLKEINWYGNASIVTLPDGIKDPNDLHKAFPQDFKKHFHKALDHALPLGQPQYSPPQAKQDFREAQEKFYTVKDTGVWYQEPSQGKPSKPLKICSRLDITAYTRDQQSENWGRLLEFKDKDGIPHSWAIPAEMFSGEGTEYRRILLSMGLEISTNPTARFHLTNYIQSSNPKKRVRCVEQTGWYDNAFVLPHETIGEINEQGVVLQNTSSNFEVYQQSSTLEDWQKYVSSLCIGNSRLIFVLSCAFASALLKRTGDESGGFHLRGPSSSGKTTALVVASSAWGNAKYLTNWRSTINGLEATASLYNDALMPIDEIGQADSKEVGNTAYMLANGCGKQRANRSGGAKKKATWRLLFLSSGEISLTEQMRQAGKRSYAGQELRIADIPADAEKGLGLFENLHGFSSASTFSKALSESSKRYYGSPIRSFLQQITKDLNSLNKVIENLRNEFTKEFLPDNANGQVHRVLNRFSLVAVAGELATQLGITGWSKGETKKAVGICFSAWLESRGGSGSQETKIALTQIQHFFELHGESRFTLWTDGNPISKTINRAGFFKKNEDGSVEYFVFSEVFKKEICEGLDSSFVAKLLLEQKWIEGDPSGKATRGERLPDGTKRRCFKFKKVSIDME